MKLRHVIFVFGLFVIGMLCFFILRQFPVQAPGKTESTGAESGLGHKRGASISPSGASPRPSSEIKSKDERMSAIIAITSLQPIAFYGKVIDQNGNPVSGVNIRASVKTPKYFMDENRESYSTSSNGDGRFQFFGLHGQDMGVALEKEGFEFKSDHKRYHYSMLTHESERHRPDPTSPVIFKMWKQQGAEPLIRGEGFFGIKGDGTPFTIDFAKGKKSEGRLADGDVIVSIIQPPEIADGQNFDWSFTVEAIDGGLIEEIDAQYLNEAPAEGYDSKISHEVKAANREWSDVVHKNIFVKSRKGNQFARVNVDVYANYQGAAVFSVHYFVNPKSGSRNLEYDSTKQSSK